MKHLLLLRHAKAEPALQDQQDWQRPLSLRGERDAAEMARRLKASGPTPQRMLSSPSQRTRQTVAHFHQIFPRAYLEFVDNLYLAEPRQLLTVIHELGKNENVLMLVGHNPGISELADQLSADRRIDGMPTAAIVTMEFRIATWQALKPAMGENVGFDWPKRQP